MDYQESNIVEQHIPCPDCGSSDGLCTYDDGHSFCFVCQKHTQGQPQGHPRTNRKAQKKAGLIPIGDLEQIPLRARGITLATCQQYGYYTGRDKRGPVQVACYYADDRTPIGQKVRTPDKDFYILGKVSDRFFGQHLWAGGKKLVVTEGEIDAMSVYQAQGSKYPVVSVPCGAKSALKTFKAQSEWLEQFGEVITMFDMDKEGEVARKAVGGILAPGKLRHAKLPLKDANECLIQGQSGAIVGAVFNAEVWKPGGIVNGKELWEAINKRQEDVKSIPWPPGWDRLDLQRMSQGIRPGEMILLTAGTGIGKSTVFRELAYYLGVTAEEPLKVGMIFLEEQNTETALALMSLHLNRRLHLSWHTLGAKERRAAFEETLGTERFVFYDHFGSLDGEELLQKIRYMIVGEGCQFIFLDHISIAISGLEGNDERKDIDVLMTRLAALIQETGVGIGVISHLRKTDNKQSPFEEGGKITLDALRGSGTLKQIPNTILAGERNQQEDDEKAKNLVRLRLLKCRFTGKTGIAGHLHYNDETGRLEPVEKVEEFLGEAEEETEQVFMATEDF